MSIHGATSFDPGRFDKPLAPEIASLQQDLGKLRSLLEQGQGADGTVDVAALRDQVAATGDPDLARELEAIIDAFPESVTRTFSSGCGGPTTRTVHEDPTILKRGDVQKALSDIAAARSALSGLDQDGDGRLNETEARGAASGLPNDLIAASLGSYRKELTEWATALDKVAYSVDARGDVDEAITSAASRHAETPQGAAALTAAYRDLVTGGGQLPDLDEALRHAEKNLLTRLAMHLPIFKKKALDGHLSDKEIGKLLGAGDLRKFTDERNQAIEQRLGGPYTDYLAGKDLAGSEHLDDKDYKARAYRSGCS